MRKLSPEEHLARPWHVHRIAPDFHLEDAWALPVTGTQTEFPAFIALWRNLDPAHATASWPTRALFALRMALGRVFGWDEQTNTLPIPGATETSIRERLPPDLTEDTTPADAMGSFRPVFVAPREWAAEVSNGTVHAILQLGWVERGDGMFQGRLGVYVKPRGWFGRVYMAAIAPFRHWVVYPALLRSIGRRWAARPQAGGAR